MTEAKYGSRTGAMKLPIWHATIKGRGEFPLDMLRYDGAWPRDESETATITHAREHREGWSIRITGTSNHGPNHARWRSFMCKVAEWGWQAK
jgi:hypothetical protein